MSSQFTTKLTYSYEMYMMNMVWWIRKFSGFSGVDICQMLFFGVEGEWINKTFRMIKAGLSRPKIYSYVIGV